jgi:hypothetical protein
VVWRARHGVVGDGGYARRHVAAAAAPPALPPPFVSATACLRALEGIVRYRSSVCLVTPDILLSHLAAYGLAAIAEEAGVPGVPPRVSTSAACRAVQSASTAPRWSNRVHTTDLRADGAPRSDRCL